MFGVMVYTIAMSYDLTIRFEGPGGDGAGIRAMLDSEPSMSRVGEGSWVLTPVAPLEVAFDVESVPGAEGAIRAIRVHIPFSLLELVSEAAFLLCFNIAEQFGGRLYDEQMGEYITPEDPAEAAEAHADFLAGIAYQFREPDRFDRWSWSVTRQSVPVMVVVLLLAMVGAVGVVFWMEIPADRAENWLFGIGLVFAVVLFSAKVGFDSWRG